MKRIYGSLLLLYIFVSVTVLYFLQQTPSQAASVMTEQTAAVEPAGETPAMPFFEQLSIRPNYLLQGGTGGASSLVGEWRFDEANGSSAADSSGKLRTAHCKMDQPGPAAGIASDYGSTV